MSPQVSSDPCTGFHPLCRWRPITTSTSFPAPDFWSAQAADCAWPPPVQVSSMTRTLSPESCRPHSYLSTSNARP
jgi:hypothetical protein